MRVRVCVCVRARFFPTDAVVMIVFMFVCVCLVCLCVCQCMGVSMRVFQQACLQCVRSSNTCICTQSHTLDIAFNVYAYIEKKKKRGHGGLHRSLCQCADIEA